MPLIAVEAKADRNGVIHLVHLRLVQPTHVLPQAALVDGPDLLQEDHRVFGQAHTVSSDVDVGRQAGLTGLAGNGGKQ